MPSLHKIEAKKGKEKPKISTASLPDIIFMLLFFFMVVTVLRDSELKLIVNTPEASELTKLERKSLVHTIYIGKPVKKYQEMYGTRPRIQLNDKISNENQIPLFIEEHKRKVPEKQRGGITTSLRIDGQVTMGVVTDVKLALRKTGQLKVNYSAGQRQ